LITKRMTERSQAAFSTEKAAYFFYTKRRRATTSIAKIIELATHQMASLSPGSLTAFFISLQSKL
jgi:hypothetical protein